MISSKDFPRLTPASHRVTSPATSDYNCIACAAGDTEHWWQPGVYWPTSIPPDDYGIGVLERAFAEFGFADCGEDDGLDAHFEKVALYGSGTFTRTPPGNCRQESGRASSAATWTLSTRHRTTLPAAFTAKLLNS